MWSLFSCLTTLLDTQEVMTEAVHSTLHNDKHRTNNNICFVDSRYYEVSHETSTYENSRFFWLKKRRHCWKLWIRVYRKNSINGKYFLITKENWWWWWGGGGVGEPSWNTAFVFCSFADYLKINILGHDVVLNLQFCKWGLRTNQQIQMCHLAYKQGSLVWRKHLGTCRFSSERTWELNIKGGLVLLCFSGRRLETRTSLCSTCS